MSERELHQYLSATAPTLPNTLWYTEARVDQMMLDYRSRIDDLEGLLRDRDVQIASLQRLLALRTEALSRVAESNEMLRAERRVN